MESKSPTHRMEEASSARLNISAGTWRRMVATVLRNKKWVVTCLVIVSLLTILSDSNRTPDHAVTAEITSKLTGYTPLPSHITDSLTARSNRLGAVVLVIFAHSRIDYFTESLKSVLAARGKEQFTLAVSVDAPEHFAGFLDAIKSVNVGNHPIEFWESILPTNGMTFPADAGMTRHLKVVMDRAFKSFEYMILLEEDLTVSPDFFEYFQATGHLIHPSNPASRAIYCISAWNDQGFANLVLDESRVFRTNFYPGLGFMFHRSFWINAMENQWPFWRSPDWGYDWWIRRYTSLKDRYVLVPEVSRTHHISRRGLHVGSEAAELYLGMPMASGNVPVSALSLAIASSQAVTRSYYKDIMRQSKTVDLADLDRALRTYRGGSLVFIFNDDDSPIGEMPFTGAPELRRLLAKFQLFPDTYRSFFQRAFTFRLREGLTRVTLVGSSMAYTYWTNSVPTESPLQLDFTRN